jgi:hypothetical protein
MRDPHFVQRFDRRLQKLGLGEAFDCSILDRHVALLFDSVRDGWDTWIHGRMSHSLAHMNRAPAVHVDFVTANEVNGFAFGDDELHLEFIGIPAGTMLVLYDLFMRLMSLNGFLPHIGDAGMPPTSHPRLATWRPIADPLLATNPVTGQRYAFGSQPRDSMRYAFAMHAADLATYFIVAHELAHLRFGHIAVASQLSPGRTVKMFDEARGPLIDGLTSQAMEYGADRYAAFHGLKLALRRSRQTLPEHVRTFYSSPQRALETWSVAIYTHLYPVLASRYRAAALDPASSSQLSPAQYSSLAALTHGY